MADVAGIRTGLSLVCSVLLCPPFCGSVGGLGWLNISGQNTRPTLSPAHLGKVRNQCHASMALLWCSAVFRFPLIFPHFFFLFFFCDPLPHFLHSVCLRIFAIMETNVVLLNLSIGWQKLPKENIALDGEFVFMGAPACLFIRWAELRCVYAPCSPFSLSLKVDWRRTWVFNLYDVFHGLIEEKQSARQWTM